MADHKFQIQKILYAGSHAAGMDYKVHYLYGENPVARVVDFQLKAFQRSARNSRNQRAGTCVALSGGKHSMETYDEFLPKINKAQLSQQVRRMRGRKSKALRKEDYEYFIQCIISGINKLNDRTRPLVGWMHTKKQFLFVGVGDPLFADIAFNNQEPALDEFLTPILLWEVVPEILPTAAYTLFAYTNCGQWTDPDGDFCKFIGKSSFNPPYTLTNIGVCPKEDILLQYIYSNPFLSNLFSTKEIPYCWPHTLLAFEKSTNRIFGDCTYPLSNLVLQKELPTISNDILDYWDSTLWLYPCLYTHTSNLEYSRKEAAQKGHIICQLLANTYLPEAKRILRQKTVKIATRTWWYLVRNFLSQIEENLIYSKHRTDYSAVFDFPQDLIEDPETPFTIKKMIQFLKPYPAHLILLLIFWSFLDYLVGNFEDKMQGIMTTEYAIARTEDLYQQLKASLLPLNSSLQLFCNYLRDIFVEQCVAPTYLHWEGVEHSGKEKCYYLDAHAWFAEFEKYAEIKLNRTDVQGEISGLLKLRPNRPALGNYRTYEGEKHYVLCILKDKLPK